MVVELKETVLLLEQCEIIVTRNFSAIQPATRKDVFHKAIYLTHCCNGNKRECRRKAAIIITSFAS